MPNRSPRTLPAKLATVLITLLLAVGFYFPTSEQQTISVRLQLASGGVLLTILAALLARRSGAIGVAAVANVVVINVTVLVCTLFSAFTNFAYGGAQTGMDGSDIAGLPGFPYSMRTQLNGYLTATGVADRHSSGSSVRPTAVCAPSTWK